MTKTADRPEILADVCDERAYQEEKWGNEFDDKNTINDWVAYITRYAGNAAFTPTTGSPEEAAALQREQLVKVATLAVAAIETIDRNGVLANRHYDG